MFEYDPKKLPRVIFRESWGDTKIYEVGSWSLDLSEEDDIEHAESAIYVWIAWYEFLKRRAEDGTKAKS